MGPEGQARQFLADRKKSRAVRNKEESIPNAFQQLGASDVHPDGSSWKHIVDKFFSA